MVWRPGHKGVAGRYSGRANDRSAAAGRLILPQGLSLPDDISEGDLEAVACKLYRWHGAQAWAGGRHDRDMPWRRSPGVVGLDVDGRDTNASGPDPRSQASYRGQVAGLLLVQHVMATPMVDGLTCQHQASAMSGWRSGSTSNVGISGSVSVSAREYAGRHAARHISQTAAPVGICELRRPNAQNPV